MTEKSAEALKKVKNLNKSTMPLASKKTTMIKPLENPRTTFELLRSQLGEVKKELSPYNWQLHVTEYADQQKAKARLKTLSEAADSGPLKDEAVEEGSPEWTNRWETLMLCEHLKKKCMEANSVFNSASQLLSQSHSIMAKDFFLATVFIDAITHIPDNTVDEMEQLQKKVTRQKAEIEELQERNDKLMMKARRKKEATLEMLTKRFDEERMSRFFAGVVSSWGFQAQEDQKVRLQGEKNALEESLQKTSEELASLQEHHRQKTEEWEKEKSEMSAELHKLRELFRRQQEETEKALKEAADLSGNVKDQEAMLIKLAKEKVLFESKIEDLEAKVAALEKALAEKTAEACTLQENLETSQAEVERLHGSIAAVEATLDETRREVRAREDDLVILSKEMQKIKAEFQRKRTELESKVSDAVSAQQEAEAELLQTKEQATEMANYYEAKFKEMEEGMRKERHDAEVRIAQVVSDADQTIANERERMEEDFKTRQEYLIQSLINPNGKPNGPVDFACHMCQKWKQKAAELERELKVRDGGTAPHLKGPEALPVDAKAVCLHCRQFVIYNEPLQLPKAVQKPPPKEDGKASGTRNRDRGVALPNLRGSQGNHRGDPDQLRRTQSMQSWSHDHGQKKPTRRDPRRAKLPQAVFYQTLPVPDKYTFVRQEGIRRDVPEVVSDFPEVWR